MRTTKIVALLLVTSSSLLSNINIKSIDFFANKSFVNQNISTSSKTVDLIGNVKLEDIRFSLAQGCSINSTELEYIDFINDNLSIKIKNLEEQINKNENQIKAYKSAISFLENSSVSSISDLKSLKETSKFVKSEILENHNKIYKIQQSLKKQEEELTELSKKRANSKFTRLNYDISCEDERAKITYPIYDITRNGFYDISYNSNDKKLDIKNSVFITQATGVDFKNIDINLYTYNFVQQLNPNKFYPEYLDVVKNPPITYKQEQMLDAVPTKILKKSAITTSSYIEDTTKSFFKVSNITLQSGKKTEVVFVKDSYKAQQSLEVDGYSSSQAFYKVDFKSNKLYGVLNSKLYLDGIYVGKAYQEEIKKDNKTSIYFATNRLIDVKKELIKDIKEEPTFSINKINSQKIWKYKITNNHKKTQKITLVERVPVSKHKDIKVKLIGKSTYKEFDKKNGKITFEFGLKPNETKIIEFGYEVKKPIK